MKLSIIILSFNTAKLTLSCVKSLFKTYKKEIKEGMLEIIVADNASSDSTVEFLNKIKEVTVVRNKNNFGFSKGNNLGAKKTRSEYLLFLNSDVEVLDKGLLGMIEFMDKNPTVGILGAKLKNPDGSEQKSSGNFYTFINLVFTLFGFDSLMRQSPKKIQKVDWVSGAFLMIRKKLFDRLGGFDEKYFMYIEDMDLCFIAKKLGFSTYFFPYIKAVHKELGSSNRTFAILNIYQGILIFYKKHVKWQYPFVRFFLILKAFISLFVGLLTNNSYLKKTYLGALRLSL